MVLLLWRYGETSLFGSRYPAITPCPDPQSLKAVARRASGLEGPADRCADGFADARVILAQQVLELGEDLFDRV
jgi:hypothetical protein